MGIFKVWCEDLGEDQEDSQKFEAMDDELAAEEWARRYDWNSGEYSIASGKEKVVSVLDVATGIISQLEVVGEAEPVYRASKVPNV